MKTLLIDDEPVSIRILEQYAAAVPFLEVVASCKNAIAAMEALNSKAVDLLFLDINMPKLSGISLLKTLSNPPLVIFTTAYPEYAVEGFELNAVDYLLKPFSLERFIKAANRARQQWEQSQNNPSLDFLILKADKKLFKIPIEDILYLQAYSDYVKVFTKTEMLLIKERLSQMEQNLPSAFFQRIHRSYIISLQALEFIEGNQVKIGKVKLPISQSFRNDLLQKLGQ